MNRRILIILLLVVVIAAVVVLVVLPQLNPPPPPATNTGPQPTVGPSPTQLQMGEVVVAIQQLPRGIKIPEGAIATRSWPKSAIPERAVTDKTKIIGQIARTDIFIEEPIVDSLLVPDLADVAKGGSDAAAVTPKGLVLISVPIDRLTSVGYGIQDGDYVDVIVSFLFVDVDPTFQSIKPNRITLTSIKSDGTINLLSGIEGELQPSNFSQFPVVVGPSEAQRPRLVTQRTIQAAWVVHAGTFPVGGQFLRPVATPLPTNTPAEGEPTKAAPPPTPVPPYPDILSIAVQPQDAVALTWLIEAKIPMTFVLRSAQGDPTVQQPATKEVNLQYMIETFQIAQPPSLPYALEPALRSIRSLSVGNFISLTDAGK